jgi:dTDP-glucose 4,6-dehydratase
VEGIEHRPGSVLVTGGAGFIGSHLVRRLLEDKGVEHLVNLDRLTYAGDLARLDDLAEDPRLENIIGDICDRALVDRILSRRRIRTVVHLAAESHVDRSIAGPAEFIRTNLTGTFTLLEACREGWGSGNGADGRDVRFVHVSTDEVFGDLRVGDPPFTEASPYAPNSPYAASKAGADHLVRSYRRTYGLPAIITHASNNYGSHQHPEKFIPTVIRSCLELAPIPVYGDGSNIRDWLHVEDHCEALMQVMARGRIGASYLVGGENEWTNLDVVRLICRIMDELVPSGAPHHRLIGFVRDRPGHDLRYATDSSRIREELGWIPTRDFESGLRATVEGYMHASRDTTATPGRPWRPVRTASPGSSAESDG